MVSEKELIEQATADGIQKCVVSAVIVHAGHVLLLKRDAADFLPGLVELPGGGIENGETLKMALIREVLEETNLTITKEDIKGYIDSFDYDSSGGKKARQFNYLCLVSEVSNLALSSEHEAFYWEDLLHMSDSRLPISEATQKILSMAAEMI